MIGRPSALRLGRRAHARALCLVAALALAAPAAFAGDRPTAFLDAIADLPLMPGLEEVDEAGLVFDKPGGRIVEAYAQGAVAADEVLDFYRRTLPQLGWRASGHAAFAREGERLTIEVAPSGAQTAVRFILAPQ